MEIALLLVLIVLNGVFAMSELALVAARRARLSSQLANGSAGAGAAIGGTLDWIMGIGALALPGV